MKRMIACCALLLTLNGCDSVSRIGAAALQELPFGIGEYIGSWLDPETDDPLLLITQKIDSILQVKQWIDDKLHVSNDAVVSGDSVIGIFGRQDGGGVGVKMKAKNDTGTIEIIYVDRVDTVFVERGETSES